MRLESYCTTYCNKAHRLVDGKPIGHECTILPPAALKAEMAGDYDEAIEILAEARNRGRIRTHRGVRA